MNRDIVVIAGVEITTDSEGRFNLNALEKAAKSSGITKDIRPNEWLSLQHTQELEEILITENSGLKPIISKPGRYGGTFAHELLAISYAGWISPYFQLQVNQVFLDYKTGKLQPVKSVSELTRMDILQMALEAEQEKLLLEKKVEEAKPKVEFYDTVSESNGLYTMTHVAQTLGIGRNKFFAALRQMGIIQQNKTIPYQKYIDQGYFKVREKLFQDKYPGFQTFVTGRGQTWLAKKCQEHLALLRPNPCMHEPYGVTH